MKKIIFLILASIFFWSCEHLDHMTKEEREEYDRAMKRWHHRYNAGQTP